MARSERVILAHVGALTPEYLRLLNVLDLWQIDYVVNRPESDISADQPDSLTIPSDRTILLRSWAWPNDSPTFMHSISAAFQALRRRPEHAAQPVIIDVLLDRRYAAQVPEDAATLTINVATQAWTSWTAQLREALRVGRGLKAEANSLEVIFTSLPSATPELVSVEDGHTSGFSTSEFNAEVMLGKVIGGYRLDRVVGEGGDTVAYHGVRSSSPFTQAEVSIMPLPQSEVRDVAEQMRERFMTAARARQDFHHPNVAPVGAAGETTEYLYEIVPYPSAPTLADLLNTSAPIPLAAVASYLSQLAAAVDSAEEQGIILSDLSPSNILITEYGHALIASVGYSVGARSAMERKNAIAALGAVLYALTTGRELIGKMSDLDGAIKPLGEANLEPWRLRLNLPAPSEAAILGALIPQPRLTSGGALCRAFGGGLAGLWTENLTRELYGDWLKWWRSGIITRGWAHTPKRRFLLDTRQISVGALAVVALTLALLLLLVGPFAHSPLGEIIPSGRQAHTRAGAATTGHSGGSVSSAQAGLAGIITTSDNPTPVPPLTTSQPGPITTSVTSDPTNTPGGTPGPANTGSPAPGPIGTGNPSPGPTATGIPIPGPTSTSDPTPGPTSTSTPGPTATPSVACVASGTTYTDNFSSYTLGLPPNGYLLRGAAPAAPLVANVKGTSELVFPYISGQLWDSWALKDEGGRVLCAPYTVTAKLTFLTSGDRGGIVIAWHDTTWDHIDIQPNIYWQDLEVRISSSLGGQLSNPHSSHYSLPMTVGTSYWLRAQVTSNGPGKGAVSILWSTDGTTFSQIASITNLADVNGLAGMGTAGYNLPQTAFGLFKFQAQ